MCVNYRPTDAEVLEAMTGLSTAGMPPWKEQIWQDYPAPIIRAGQDGVPELTLATYGMIPKDKIPSGFKLRTLNARGETVGEKRSYSSAWHAAQTCLIPTMGFYEPNWETGTAKRWEIGMADGSPFFVAGLWRAWDEVDRLSFTQLTVNADDHELMRRFHRPGHEKRSLVIIPREQCADWLNVGNPEIARAYLQLYPAHFMAATPAAKGYRQS